MGKKTNIFNYRYAITIEGYIKNEIYRQNIKKNRYFKESNRTMSRIYIHKKLE